MDGKEITTAKFIKVTIEEANGISNVPGPFKVMSISEIQLDTNTPRHVQQWFANLARWVNSRREVKEEGD